jgi:hypothetical protein
VHKASSERRRAERAYLYLETKWEGESSLEMGTISDVSENGCFVLTSGKVKRKELVKLEIKTPTLKSISVWGEVVYFYQEIGFGLCFTNIDQKEKELIALLVDYSS